jgi:hypothetical protein
MKISTTIRDIRILPPCIHSLPYTLSLGNRHLFPNDYNHIKTILNIPKISSVTKADPGDNEIMRNTQDAALFTAIT